MSLEDVGSNGYIPDFLMWMKMPASDSKHKEVGEDGSLEEGPCQALRRQERKSQKKSSLKTEFPSAGNISALLGNHTAQQTWRGCKGRKRGRKKLARIFLFPIILQTGHIVTPKLSTQISSLGDSVSSNILKINMTEVSCNTVEKVTRTCACHLRLGC